MQMKVVGVGVYCYTYTVQCLIIYKISRDSVTLLL